MQHAPASFLNGVGREDFVRKILCRVAGVSDTALGWAHLLTLGLGLDVFFDMCFCRAVRVCCCSAVIGFHPRLALKRVLHSYKFRVSLHTFFVQFTWFSAIS